METPDIIYLSPYKQGVGQDYIGLAWTHPSKFCNHVAYVRRDLIEGMIRDKKERIEQKPAEKQDYSGLTDLERAIHRGFLSAGVENVSVTIIKETAQECLAQMKSAEWDELQSEFKNINKAFKDGKKEVVAHPERYGLCKPAEWSEEDERILTGIIERGSSQVPFGEPALRGEQMEWLMNRLKSLRNRVGKEFLQPHWKPTEEQMKWLKDVIETVPMTCRQQVPLESLYNDLLKLANDCINTYHRTFIQEL